MPPYKNQHYVPQFFFRGWTDDDRIPAFHLENETEYPPTHISNLCSEDYFYGDAESEEETQGLESLHAGVINKLRRAKDIRALTHEEVMHFCIFILYLRNRTKWKRKEMDYMVDQFTQELARSHVEAGWADEELLDAFNDWKVVDRRAFSYAMLSALTGPDLIKDLEIVLLINESDREFVFSDHPIVHDNRRYKDEMDRFLVGIQNRGLQVYCPLADDLQAILYDPACYAISYENQDARTVITDSELTVEGLNDVQMINADEYVFYRTLGQEEEMIESLDRVRDDRPDEPLAIKRHTGDHDLPTDNEVIESGTFVFDYTIHMPFMRERPYVPHQIERVPGLKEAQDAYLNEIMEEAEKHHAEK